ncbi:MAG: nitrous oxide-stimulated promoter family protein [Clostridiales bacterium]|nr:nitrous oxide-stimulated promoter family protein [Clostridiales bacterium]
MTHIEREQLNVEQMIRIYCRRKEGNRELCPDCVALLKYAKQRLVKCPFGENKTSCRKCTVHCYRPDMKERIRSVMRYSGPWMMIYHPIATIRHIIT